MKKCTLLLFVLFLGLLSSCNQSLNTDISLLYGSWANFTSNEDTITLKKSPQLLGNEYGIEFKKNGKLIESSSISWCGTPPVTYVYYEGKWSVRNSKINISANYWGGHYKSKWEIISIDNTTLRAVVKTEYPDQ